MRKVAPSDECPSCEARRFLRRHHERLYLISLATELGCSVDEAHRIREAMAVLTLLAMAMNKSDTSDIPKDKADVRENRTTANPLEKL